MRNLSKMERINAKVNSTQFDSVIGQKLNIEAIDFVDGVPNRKTGESCTMAILATKDDVITTLSPYAVECLQGILTEIDYDNDTLVIIPEERKSNGGNTFYSIKVVEIK